ARYWVQAKCLSPLRTGGTDGDTETVLTGPDGICFLQGSSLAGAFRDWTASQMDEKIVNELFGAPQTEGRLIFSDGKFDPDTRVGQRPRLRIDRVTGTAAQG